MSSNAANYKANIPTAAENKAGIRGVRVVKPISEDYVRNSLVPVKMGKKSPYVNNINVDETRPSTDEEAALVIASINKVAEPITAEQEPKVRKNTKASKQQVITEVVQQKVTDLLTNHQRITIGCNGMAFKTTVLDIRESGACIYLVSAISTDSVNFVPTPGTWLTIDTEDRTWNVLYAGTYMEYPELGISMLALIKGNNNGKA